jgi:6-phosphogluconolactonase
MKRLLGLLLALLAAPGCASRPHGLGLLVFGGRTDVAVFAFDAATTTLTERSRMPQPGRTAYLAVSPDRRFVFAGNGEEPGRITAFALEPGGGLRRLNDQFTATGGGPMGISHVAVHPEGRWLLTAHLKSGRISVLPIAGDGQLGPPTFTELFGVGAHQVVIDRSGRQAHIPVRDGQFVGSFTIDTGAGRLLPVARVPSAPGSGPRHLAFTPDERFAYVNNEANGTVTAYHHQAGRLEPFATVPTVPEGYSETGSGHVLVHRSGRFVFTSNRFHGSIAVHAIDPATGGLRLVEITTAGGDLKFPRDFDLDPSGRFMFVGNERGNSISILSVDPATGRLQRTGPPLPAPTAPQVLVAL